MAVTRAFTTSQLDSRVDFYYTATSGQTTFSGSDDNGSTLSYTASGKKDVYLNGTLLIESDDYVATNGTSVVLQATTQAGDILHISVNKVMSNLVNIVDTSVDLNGNELILDADGDTSITADTDDQIDIKTGGTDSISITPSQITITDADSNQPRLLLKNTNADSTPPFLDFQKDSSSPADNDVIGKIRFIGDDDGGNTVAYATIASTSPDVSDGSENGDLRFETIVDGTNAERMRIDSSGNVGIGTSSPDGKLTVSDTGEDNALYVLGGIKQDDGPGNPWYLGKGILGSTGSEFLIGNASNELLRIEQSGTVYVGTSNLGTVGSTDGIGLYNNGLIGSSATSTRSIFSRRSSNGQVISFRRDTTDVGSISVTTTSTAYNTSSDYRLKENVDYTFDATTRLKQLKPARFNFITDADTTVDGFIAHEVSDIVPEAVTGDKDAMMTEEYEVTPAVLDDDGNIVEEAVMGTREVPDYQGIDQSKLVPLLVKTIQELEARITALENN